MNESGLIPTEFKCIIKEMLIDNTTQGGIIIPEIMKEREQMAQVKGELVAISPAAFTYADWPEGARIPAVGDQVYFAKFAGARVQGNDGNDYRIVNDKDIAAIIEG